MRRPGSNASLLFRLVVPAVVVFIGTILVMIAVLFGDPRAPVVGWIDQNTGWLLTVEFIVIIALALLAMTVDRIVTLRSGPTQPAESPQEHPTDPPNTAP